MKTGDDPFVLLLTHHRDYYTIDLVAEALVERGARPLRVDTDRFPGELRLSCIDRGQGPGYLLDDGQHMVEGHQVAAVWTRSIWPPVVLREVDPEYREACTRQSAVALEGFLDGLGHARWISPMAKIRRSENKLFQHRMARASGLAIPRTLVTNDPEQVRRFYDLLEGRMVTKVLWALSRSMGRSGPFVPTSEVSVEDLEHLEGLRYGPMIFQERIEKELELRVKYIDGQVFCGGLDARETEAGETDWRLSRPEETPWRPAELPAEIQGGLRRFMSSCGLLAGAVDFIRTPAGEHVFLEVNPLGEWGMLQKELDLPIAQAIAAALVSYAPESRDTSLP
jgi:MvdC family ATP-grasp ribosomal peptide maturase